jgi:excinuclease UvrABC helicase subunit UvrB
MCLGLVLLVTKSLYVKAVTQAPQESRKSDIIEPIYRPDGELDTEAMSRELMIRIQDDWDREARRADAQRAANRVVTPLNGSSQW